MVLSNFMPCIIPKGLNFAPAIRAAIKAIASPATRATRAARATRATRATRLTLSASAMAGIGSFTAIRSAISAAIIWIILPAAKINLILSYWILLMRKSFWKMH